MSCIDPKDMPPDQEEQEEGEGQEKDMLLLPMHSMSMVIKPSDRLAILLFHHPLLESSPALYLTEKELVHAIRMMQQMLMACRLLPLLEDSSSQTE